MSSVRIVFPKPLLARLIKEPGGMAIADAIEQAQANLDELRPAALEELQKLVVGIEAMVAEHKGKPGVPPNAGEMYTLASNGIGMGQVAGVEGVDTALTSFCKLVDHLQNRRTWNPSSVAVHLQAMRFLAWEMYATPAEAQAMLTGLERITARYNPDGSTAA